MIVIDAFAAVDLLVDGPGARATRAALLERSAPQAPHLIDVEVLHALRRWTLRGMMAAEAAAAALEAFDTMFPLTRHAHVKLRPRTWELREAFSAYDAMYVALAEILDAPLVTADRRIARAAAGLVEVVPALG